MSQPSADPASNGRLNTQGSTQDVPSSNSSSLSNTRTQPISRANDPSLEEEFETESNSPSTLSRTSTLVSTSRFSLLSRSKSEKRPSTGSSSNTAASASTSGKRSLIKTLFKQRDDKPRSSADTNQTLSSGDSGVASSEAGSTDTAKPEKGKPRDPVKTVPSGKPPATNFADLAYRYGSPGGPSSGRRL
ncbi:hypothetical protein SIIN_7003_T [Serendipita indica DSM 11827]|nr:hypothetical protein SIIN_7003_T [Serendipita indica DSM 11827]